MNRNPAAHRSPFIRLILSVFILLLLIYIPLKIYIASTDEPAGVPDGSMIRVYLTNELHGYREPCERKKDEYSGMARWASFIDSRRSDVPVLLLDTGDFFGPELTKNDEIDYRYFFEGMKLMGYDAVNIGANDILYGRDRLQKAAKDGNLPLVSSNILDRRNGGLLAKPCIIKYLGGKRTFFGMREGIRVGIFSVTDPSFFDQIDNSVSKSYKIKDPRITALEAISRLKEKRCDLIIAISHMGWENSVRFASDVSGIDIVVNGHRGHEETFQQHAGSTLIVDTGIHRISFTEIEARFNKGKLLLQATDMGGIAHQFAKRADLRELELKYRRELRKKGIEDKRENTIEIEKNNRSTR